MFGAADRMSGNCRKQHGNCQSISWWNADEQRSPVGLPSDVTPRNMMRIFRAKEYISLRNGRRYSTDSNSVSVRRSDVAEDGCIRAEFHLLPKRTIARMASFHHDIGWYRFCSKIS